MRDQGRRRPIRRLGVYSDGPYGLIDANGAPRLVPDPADHPFLTFAYAVGRALGTTVVFARARRVDDASTPLLPDDIGVVELPYYSSLTDLGGLVRAVPGTVRGFWRGLALVDGVWVLGPHPYAFLLISLALVRRRTVVLGVRQDSLSYYRARLPNARWKPALAAAWVWELGFRLLARGLRITVVGPELARRYGGEREGLLVTTVSQLRDADVLDEPEPKDWTGPISLFTAGRIDPEKNPLLLVDALARLEAERPGRFRLAWAGTGPLEGEVRRRALELGVAERIELLGFVPFGPALLERYRRAHAFVHVSLTEGVPATVLEAHGCGTPVVATAVGGVPFALDEGAAGILVPPNDLDALVAGILRLVDEPELREQLVRNGLRLARERTLEASSSRVARFIAGEDAGPAPDLAEGTDQPAHV